MEKSEMQEGNIHSLLHPYFDGELDFSESVRFEEHLKECNDCSRVLEEQRKLRSALEHSALGFTAPNKLRQRIQTPSLKSTRSSKTRVVWNWKISGIAASIA